MIIIKMKIIKEINTSNTKKMIIIIVTMIMIVMVIFLSKSLRCKYAQSTHLSKLILIMAKKVKTMLVITYAKKNIK